MQRDRGFTMVELLIAVGIVALLSALAAPALRGVIENARIRAVSESWQNGMALARTAAVRLNTNVEFTVLNGGWQVNRLDTGEILHRGAGKEGTSGLSLTYTPTGADSVTFDAFGRALSANPDGTATLTRIDLRSAVAPNSSTYKPLAVQIQASGMSRVCDPAETSTTARGCL